MATKRKANSELAKDRNVVIVARRGMDETPEAASARVLTRPSIQAAATIQRWQGENQEVNALADELSDQIAVVNKGDLSRAEGLLLAQAHTLDEIFNNLARRARMNMGEHLNAAETYLRLALKAQSQCRATLETLAAIKNPPIVYARQANIANGPQQVNNGQPSRTREIKNQQSKLSGSGNELLQDTGAPTLKGEANPKMEALEAINRTENSSG